MELQGYIKAIELELIKNANPKIASKQKAYMRGQFEYLGLKSVDRRALYKPFLKKERLPAKIDLKPCITMLWEKPQRDFQYFGQELAQKYLKQLDKKDMAIFEFMVIHKSWWDTVDFIACNLMGSYFKTHPEKRSFYVEKWLSSENIWLQRSALLFQLKYKDQLDTDLLSLTIMALLGTKEFFINKAIGWILREYGKTNPIWVRSFVSNNSLSTLSHREALRLIK